MIRALIYLPGAKPADHRLSWEALRAVIDGYPEAVNLSRPRVVAWCDDDFRSKRLPDNLWVPVARGSYVLGGPVYVTRLTADGSTGSLTDEDVTWCLETLKRAEDLSDEEREASS